MAVDTQVGTLIINRLTKAQYDSITPSETELYLVPDDTGDQINSLEQATASLSASIASVQNLITVNSGSWNDAATNSHTHTNKAVLDDITAAKTSSWDTAATNNHTHTNKAVLDDITAAKTASWDAAKPGTVTSITVRSGSAYLSGNSTISGSGTALLDLATGPKNAITWVYNNSGSVATSTAITSAINALVTASGSAWTADTDRYVNTASFASTGSNGAIGVKMTLTRAGADTGTVVATIPTASTAAAGVMTGAQVTALNNATALTASLIASAALAKNVTAITASLIASGALAKTAVQSSATASWASAATWVAGNSGNVATSTTVATAINNLVTASGSVWSADTDRYVNTASFASTGSAGANGVKMTLTRKGSDTGTVTATIPVASATAAGVMTGAQFKSFTSGTSWVGANSASFTRVVASASLATSANTWVAANSGNLATVTSSMHSHTNKAVLDGITAADTASWKAAYAGDTIPFRSVSTSTVTAVPNEFTSVENTGNVTINFNISNIVNERITIYAGVFYYTGQSITFGSIGGSPILWSDSSELGDYGLYEFNVLVQKYTDNGDTYYMSNGILTRFDKEL